MIPAGTKLGVYELTSPLGAGGMGEVYRARDTRLGREVAVKVLPGEFAADPLRRARFEQEARNVAALNHPNIVAVYDVGIHTGIAYMVTELIDGTTLRGAALTQRKILDVAAQVADGLAAAHRAGVTHRDIKPENIMVTRDGRAKILDFGIAKGSLAAAADAATNAPTEAGVLVGTVGYMSPEQVRGDAVDHRTDIFSFGAMLYELLSQKRAFTADTAAEIMTAILKKDPPELPGDVPPGIREIVTRCLEKGPEQRFQSAQDLAFALRQFTGSSSTLVDTARTEGRRKPRTGLWLAAAGMAAGFVLATFFAVRWSAAQDAALDPIQLTRIAADRRGEFEPSFSPDGRSVAYLRQSNDLTEVLVKSFDAVSPITLAESSTAIDDLAWSPDGKRVCYVAASRIFTCVGAVGGTPQRVLEDAAFAEFTPDGSAIVFIRADGGKRWLYRSSPPGGEPQRVGAAALSDNILRLAPVSPDGTRLVALDASGGWLISIATGTARKLSADDQVRTTAIAWLPDSRHFAATQQMGNPIGFRVVVVDSESASRRVIVRSGDPIYSVSVSSDGKRIVYSAGEAVADLVEYSIDGKRVRDVASSSYIEIFPSWAPKGDRFVYIVGGPGQSDSLWTGRADSPAVTLIQKLAFSGVLTTYRISPDGKRIAYVDPSGIQILSSEGGRPIEALKSSNVDETVCWSADGEWIWYSQGTSLRKLPSQGGEPVVVEGAPGILADCSPDGRWLVLRGRTGLVLTSVDGKNARPLAEHSTQQAYNTVQFGEGGKVLYLLPLNRRSLDVIDVASGQKRRTIEFDMPAEDAILCFSVNAAGTRVLLTTGGDHNDIWLAEGFAQPTSSWRRWFYHWETGSLRAAPAP